MNNKNIKFMKLYIKENLKSLFLAKKKKNLQTKSWLPFTPTGATGACYGPQRQDPDLILKAERAHCITS